MSDFFEDKVALVTGASRGIGYAIASSLAERKVKLALISTRLETISQVAKEIEQKYGVDVLPLAVDVTDFDGVCQAVEQAQEKLGPIDFLINNAGITRDSLFVRMSVKDWDDVVDTNLKGSFHCAKAVCKAMMKRRQGSIINITSVVGLMGNPGQANYTAAKAGVIGFTKTLARELAPRNIRVNAIAPGFIQSSMTDKIPDKIKDEMKSRIPLGIFGVAENIADCVTFLLSPSASYITGSVIQVDGGLNM